MSIALLTKLIGAFCISHVHSPSFDKVACIEQIVNCAIVEDGKVRTDYQICFKTQNLTKELE
jgi:hypothetical protein